MKVDPDEPLVTEQEVEDMRMFSPEEAAAMRGIFERGVAEARRRAQYEPETYECCSSGWIVVQKGGFTYAEPCPTHKPDWTHPDDRKSGPTDEDIRAAKKREVQGWLDK